MISRLTSCSCATVLALSACTPTSIVSYDAEAPPLVSVTIGAPPVTDGRARFREIFCERLMTHADPAHPGECDRYLHKLRDEPAPDEASYDRLPIERLHVLFVTGYLGDAAPGGMKPFGPSIERLRVQGYAIDFASVTGEGSSDYNAALIADDVEQMDLEESDKLVLIGYSKGVTDILHFLVNEPAIAARVDAVVSVAGAVNGSLLADTAPQMLVDFVATVGGSDRGDKGGLVSLKRSVQVPWLAANPLPAGPKYLSLGAFTDRKNVSAVIRDGYDELATVDPRNDSQVIYYDQVVAGSTLLGYVNCDHWAITLPFTEEAPFMASTLATRNAFPRDALFEALMLYVRELW